MKRLAILVLLAAAGWPWGFIALGTLPLAGCAGVPVAVAWTTVGAGLGFGAAALKLDDDVLQLYERDHPPAGTLPGAK